MRSTDVPFVDLQLQLVEIRADVEAAIARVVGRQDFILGLELALFETAFAKAMGCVHAAGVGTGTDAIELALRAAGVRPGDEVITSAHTFIASLLGIERMGARPVLVDCEPRGFLLDVVQVERALTQRTRAILPVHIYGQPTDLRPLAEIIAARQLVVVEDACQAHGATLGGVPAGALGDAAAFSFYPGNNLGAYGDGGAVTTSNAAIHQRLLALRNHGSPQKHHHPGWGTNSRLDEIQAAILSVKLPRLAAWNRARDAAARGYAERLADVASLTLPEVLPDRTHAWHLYVVRLPAPARDRVLAQLRSDGIGAALHYPTAVHLHGAMAHLGHREGSFPEAEQAAREVLSLPLFPEIAASQQDLVAASLRRALL